jgi:uncharacterized protein (TIGR02147 family)
MKIPFPKQGAAPINYRHWLASELEERRMRNPVFSLRSFAKKLGVSPTTLSLLLSGKRRLTPRLAERMAARLNLSPVESHALVQASRRARVEELAQSLEPDSYHSVEMDTFKVISDWYHYAILSLGELKKSKASPRWIAKRLGIPLREAEEAYHRLKRLGILGESEGGRFRQLSPPLATSDDLNEPAIRKHVLQHLHIAEQALDTAERSEMDFSSLTMAIDPAKLPLAKAEIKKFRRRLCRLLETDPKERVFALSVQLYPLEKGE